jgi:pimeloyl-ACP methyl ester carboxylesterase
VQVLRDGGHLNYTNTGSGRPIVLLHGWGMRGEFFRNQIAALSPRHRVVVPDLRGHGDSSFLADRQGLQTLVDDVAELLVELDLSEAILVGWSMGAMIGWGIMQRPEAGRVSALVTIDMVPRLLNDGTWKFGLREGHNDGVFDGAVDRMAESWPDFTRKFIPRIFARNKLSERKTLMEWLIRETQSNDPASMARLWRSMVNQDFRSQLSGIKIPCLVAYGAHSQLYSEAASQWVVSRLPDARGIRFADSGHAPHLEEFELFNQEVEKFAAQTTIDPPDGPDWTSSERI